jgi:hypothetical protein
LERDEKGIIGFFKTGDAKILEARAGAPGRSITCTKGAGGSNMAFRGSAEIAILEG